MVQKYSPIERLRIILNKLMYTLTNVVVVESELRDKNYHNIQKITSIGKHKYNI